jgi:ABC-2 type transport system ATP-binding protein
MTDPVVRTRDLHKEFGEVGVLEGVDLSVPEDETTLLLGPNGSGKTILLSCLAGGLSPSEGNVEVFGHPPRKVRSELTFALQNSLAMPELTGRENAEFYEDLHPRASGEWREVADELGLDELDRRVRDYSGGMVRKIELAITLGVDVPLYLLDEPTAELDMTTVDAFHSLVERKRSEGKTVVATSHLPGDLSLADHIAFVREGNVVATGDPTELIAEVPRVVTLGGTGARTGEASDHLRQGRSFEAGQGRRAFLEPGATVEDLRAATPDATPVETEEPSATDLFNYFVHVRPTEADGSARSELVPSETPGGD